MVRTRIELSDTSVPFAEQIPVSINFNIADVREPDKYKGSFSKTINLPATNEINKIFENIFEVNIATNTFNKNLKTKVKYFVDEIKNFEGDLQLLQIKINSDNSIVYECSIKGEGGSLFVDIGEKYITGNADPLDDLDFSAYNHTYDRATQISTRSNYGTGLGVLYPFIQRGTNGGNDVSFITDDFLPCFHVYEYVKKIIEATGRTYTSSFLTNAEFKKHIIYPNILKVSLSQLQIDNKQFYCGLNADYALTNNVDYIVAVPNETAPFFDGGNQGFAGNTYFKISSFGSYNFVASHKISTSFTHTNANVSYARATHLVISTIRKSSDGGVTWFVVNTVTNAVETTSFHIVKGSTYTYTNAVASGASYGYMNDLYEHRVTDAIVFITYYNAGGGIETTGGATWTQLLKSGSTGSAFYALLTDKTIVEGDTMTCNNALPVKIKQKDFLKSIINAFNLQIDVDKADVNNLIIETFDTFYNSTILNYENKTDLDKEQICNVNTFDVKKYVFSYKADVDYWNTKYQTDWKENFGTEQIDVETDFAQGEQKNELIFSATPNVANYSLGIAQPKIYKDEASVITPIACNIRLLTCGGVKQTINPYTYRSSGLANLITYDYLYAGHTDDPFTPTIDLNFGTPKEVYYNYVAASFTDNNLYNRFRRNYILNITDRDAKFFTKYLWINSKELSEFNFRFRLFIDGAYYIVNKIDNYTPLDETSTKFELIKLLHTAAYTPTLRDLITTDIAVGVGVKFPTDNTNTNTGDGNIIGGTANSAFGSNIVMESGSNNNMVMGTNIVVQSGVSNFVGLGISNMTIDPSYSNRTITSSVSTKHIVSITDKAISNDYDFYTIDSFIFGADVDIYLPTTNENRILTFKRVDSAVSAWNINFYSDGTDTIDTVALPLTYIPTNYDSITLRLFNGNWNQI